jgi:glycogen debranching enzyme
MISSLDPPTTDALKALLRISTDALTKNIHPLEGRQYLVAGDHQFKSLWTRDFLWSVRGLLKIGREDVVQSQLDKLLESPPKEPPPYPFLLPRTLDSMNTNWRVIQSASGPRSLFLTTPLKRYYIDQYKHVAFDGNMLLVLAAHQYREITGHREWWDANKAKLADALTFYDSTGADGGFLFRKGGLLVQPPFSDWQDSVKRLGATFYCNMVYVCALTAVASEPEFHVDPQELRAMRERIEETFFDATIGLYRSMADGPQVSLDGNLLAIDLDYLPPDRKATLLTALRSHSLWTNGPGFATAPPYEPKDKSWIDRLVGLEGYHDTLYWSWLMALAAKVSATIGVQGASQDAIKIIARLRRMAERDGSIAEVFQAHPEGDPEMKRTRLYKSEKPFSWGAAFVADMAVSLLG